MMVEPLRWGRTLWGPLSNKTFCVPCFLPVAKRLQPLRLSPSSKGQIQIGTDKGDERMQK